ncbi:MAG: UTP--glucose-1-phosphate uridylyltransferase, partial [Bifidobacterium crudilactis]|nr:UTP--glucose-1-phosphate uridylyltransferase [Bifidobacterium crudilactis]
MSDAGFEQSAAKMRDKGLSEVAISQFERLYSAWRQDESGDAISEKNIKALTDIPSVRDVHESIDADKALEAFSKTAFLKLNGGLGTSMGLEGAKSMLPVRRHKARQMRFLDIILGQVLTARKRLEVPLPLTFMNSFRTSADTKRVLNRNKAFEQHDIPVEIIQHIEPKILADNGEPVDFPDNRDLEWCPPGHGDVFSTIHESGLLEALEEQGIEYLFISNSDNLGARPSRTLAGHFAESGSSFMVEVAKRTNADRKGGHIVVDKHSGQLLLREMSQVRPGDKRAATNIKKHPYFNTNSIWVRV